MLDAGGGDALPRVVGLGRVAPEQVQILWERPAETIRRLGSGPTYVPRPSDSGEIVACHVLGTNAGGQGAAEPGPQSVVRIRS